MLVSWCGSSSWLAVPSHGDQEALRHFLQSHYPPWGICPAELLQTHYYPKIYFWYCPFKRTLTYAFGGNSDPSIARCIRHFYVTAVKSGADCFIRRRRFILAHDCGDSKVQDLVCWNGLLAGGILGHYLGKRQGVPLPVSFLHLFFIKYLVLRAPPLWPYIVNFFYMP